MYNKCALLLIVASCLAFVAAYPLEQELQLAEYEPSQIEDLHESHIRHARSPQHGSVVVTATKDNNGREASIQYNHNLYTSPDKRGTIDAYAMGSRNIDYNRNNYGGGVQAKWSF